jgi:hypothetical protein
MNEFDAHQSSYEHNHRQRLKDMKQIQKDPLAAEKARKAEARANNAGLKSIKLTPSSAASEKPKKGGFKTVFKASKGSDDAGADKEKQQLDKGFIPGLQEVVQEAPEQDEDEVDEAGGGLDDSVDYPGKGIVDWEGNDEIWNEPDPKDPDYYDPTRPGKCGDNCPCPLAQAKRRARLATGAMPAGMFAGR